MEQLDLFDERPTGIDLFSNDGGAGRGYTLAGFRMIGADIKDHTEYPYEWHSGDALALLPMLIERYRPAFIHASPPCQAYTPLNAYNHKTYPDLIAATREALRATGLPYVIENVPQAPLEDPIELCGAMFGLPMYRHRRFELGGWTVEQPQHPAHVARCARNGYLPTAERPFMSIHGGKHSKAWQRAAAQAMGVPWVTTIQGVCEAIPPAYTRWIGERLMPVVRSRQSVPALVSGRAG